MTRIDDLNADHDKLVARREELRRELLDLGAQQRELADKIARAEQESGDDQALDALRDRGGVNGAIAARGIAATMPDPDRAARFDALAQELLSEA